MKPVHSVLVFALLTACGTPDQGSLVKNGEIEMKNGEIDANEAELAGFARFPAKEWVLLGSPQDPTGGLLMGSTVSGQCQRFLKGELAKNEKLVAFELGQVDANGAAQPLTPGFYHYISYDDPSTVTGRWTGGTLVLRDEQCNDTLGNGKGTAQLDSGGAQLVKLSLAQGGETAGAFVGSFGPTGNYRYYGRINASFCDISAALPPPNFTCR
jgi:hypothetical protein